MTGRENTMYCDYRQEEEKRSEEDIVLERLRQVRCIIDVVRPEVAEKMGKRAQQLPRTEEITALRT